MSTIPCKKCPSCGLYHDLTVTICDECGSNIKDVPAIPIDVDSITVEEFGQIEVDGSLPVFVQKCPRCGSLNFTPNPEEPVKRCYNCHKVSIASIVPAEYINGTNEGENEIAMNHSDDSAKETNDYRKPSNNSSSDVEKSNDDDDDEETDGVALWAGLLQTNIGKAVSSKASKRTAPDSQVLPATSRQPSLDEEDDDNVDWFGIPEKKKISHPTGAPGTGTSITLTAITFGHLSFSIEANENSPYMLGRSANQGEFLALDGRVGNEHCYIFYKDGFWFVKDNHSANGTAVNSKDIGLNGEHKLNNGDELKLGHHSDSMAFRITI